MTPVRPYRSLSGGLELLFNGEKDVPVELGDRTSCTVAELLVHVRDHVITQRPELFMIGNDLYVST